MSSNEKLATRLIAGPCAIESLDHCLKLAAHGIEVSEKYDLDYFFKACFDKDCRSSMTSFYGVGIDEGLKILQAVKDEFGIKVVSDISWAEAASPSAEVLDMIQVPAYLCRQTHLLRAIGETGLDVHLKKGQFINPINLKKSYDKLKVFGAGEVTCTDRGTFFGYSELVNDFAAWFEMQEYSDRTGFDATHSIQLPTGVGEVSGGKRYLVPHLARAAGAIGYDTLFAEFHDDPPSAKSDSGTVIDMLHLDKVVKNFVEMRDKFIELQEGDNLGFEVHQVKYDVVAKRIKD